MRFHQHRQFRATLIAAAASVALLTASFAMADGASGSDTVHDWSGLYAGVNLGAAFGAFKEVTKTGPGAYFNPSFGFVSTDLGQVNGYGNQHISPTGFDGGAEIGYDKQNGNFVAGFAVGFDYLNMEGDSWGSGTYKDKAQFEEAAYGNADWLVTFRPRVGYATDNQLFYVTGGLALANPREDMIFSDANGAVESAARNSLQAGYVLGAGLEWALNDRLSMKAEYLHVGFGNDKGHETSTDLIPPVVDPAQAFAHSFGFNTDIFRFGLNYRLGEVDALFDDSPMTSSESPDWLSDWQADVGLRLWASQGKIGAPNPLLNYFAPPTIPKILASRIVFSNLNSISGETYGRFDHASGFFVKGYVGAGGIDYGRQNDEDFPAEYVYSNTLSTASGSIGYATIDGGYSFLRTPTANIGAFVGYNYYLEHVNSFGCTQIAMDYFCGAPAKSPGLIQDDSYHSVRLGVTTQVMPAKNIRLTADIAYLPGVQMDGRDDHNFRQLLLPESATSGDGVMLDASADYLLTNAWSVGVGARYWTYNMGNGASVFDFLGAPPPMFKEPALYNSERYGFFLQSEYRFGALPEATAPDDSQPADWTGIYGGLTLGGARTDGDWRDPYGSTTFFGVTNQAGFGDSDHASGPLAGGRLAANYQWDNFVAGLEAEASWADLRSQATCYSGLGGVNCGHHIGAVYDVAARGGYAWDRWFGYLKAGGAIVSEKENVFGDSYAFYEGTTDVTGNGNANKDLGGWLVGMGFEYAIDDSWTSSFEYNHIGGLSSDNKFPTVAVIGATSHHVSQDLNFINVGVSYKLY
jgi:opacity protein-like surface antigen